jgi:ABC-type sugar transport system substrate-binding protein
MAGAIEALKGAGVNPGDLFIVSGDGTRGGLSDGGWLVPG